MDDLHQEKSWWKRRLLSLAGFHGRTSTLIRHANYMYHNCLERTDDPKLVQALGLSDEFVSRFELLSLHIWMCLARLRMDGKTGSKLSQELFDNFWDDMMNEIRAKGVKELAVNKHLVELQERFFGAALAYDESMSPESKDADMVLAAALWRNLYSGEPDVSIQQMQMAVGYTRSQLQSLCRMPPEQFIRGDFDWGKVRPMKMVHAPSSNDHDGHHEATPEAEPTPESLK